MQPSNQKQSRIEWFSQQIEINPQDTNLVLSRSNEYELEGRINEAVSDCSKLIMISPSRELYAKRSRLFKDRGMFSLALQDLAEASCLEKDSNEETAVDIFLQSSICIKSIKEASQMASIVEQIKQKVDVTHYTNTLNELLHIKDLQIQKVKKEKENQINRIKKQYQNQTNSLREMLMEHLLELKEKISLNIQNYEEKFLNQLEKHELTDRNKQKMRIYFQNVSSEMEKYYVAAKNLHKIDDKTIKFQDFQNIIVSKKNKPDILRVIYKFFDSYSDKIQKIISLIQNVPYIGTVFNVLKATMKVQGWIEQTNIQNQCHNIERIAFNITSFNEFSTNLALFMAFHFQNEILAEHPKYQSQWWQLVEKIKQIKRESIGKNGYKKPADPQMDVVKDYAVIHASIIMVAYACNCLKFTREDLKLVNKIYDEGGKAEQTEIRKVFKIITQIELGLKKNNKQETPNQIPKEEKSYCTIY